MKFRAIANPRPSKGVDVGDPKLVRPNMAMSLEEILHRFTRNEPLEIGRQANYDDGPDDLEKLRFADLVDRDEAIQKQVDKRKQFDREERERKAKRLKDAHDQAVREAAEKLKNAGNGETAK